jgi:branched-chain amino acid transport system substrate-binding protein
LWGVVDAGKPPQPAYVMDIVRVFPPDQVFEACAG